MNEVVFALALKNGGSFVVVDGPFTTFTNAMNYKTSLQHVVKLSKESFEKALQWDR